MAANLDGREVVLLSKQNNRPIQNRSQIAILGKNQYARAFNFNIVQLDSKNARQCRRPARRASEFVWHCQIV
jgi:hypothetical protein